MTDIKPELIEKARLLTDWSQHEYRVDSRTWIPSCVCGWTSTEPGDVEGFDRHITGVVLATVADDLRADAWDEGHMDGCTDPYRHWDECDCGPNPYRKGSIND